MLTGTNNHIERVVGWLLALLFAGLIGTVFMQVFARNVLLIPLVWTLDLAQLLFVWSIFLGAALAFRRGQHYEINVWPERGLLSWIPRVVVWVGSTIVIGVLINNGYAMTLIGLNREMQSLGFSQLWFYLPIPLSGCLMALFLAEKLLNPKPS